ncbi:MAG: AraC family transcriptional regulator [Erysipelotrichaceae bacterium]|nr:AraC family transcriptional regulator [Erysipelotrichaceae bacterium]
MDDERFPEIAFTGTTNFRCLRGLAALRLAADFDKQLHTHSFWEFWILIDGACQQKINGNTYLLRRGDVYLIRPNDAHCFFPVNDMAAEHLAFAVQDSFFKQYCDYLSPALYQNLKEQDLIRVFLNDLELRQYLNNVSIFLSPFNQPDVKEMLAKRMIAFLMEIVLKQKDEQTNFYPAWLNDLILEINKPENLSAFPSDIVKKFPYSHQYILRQFKRFTGKTLVSYLNTVKLAKAAERLATHQCSVLDASLMLGFSSESYFNHLFKKTYGVSPTKYIETFSPK